MTRDDAVRQLRARIQELPLNCDRAAARFGAAGVGSRHAGQPKPSARAQLDVSQGLSRGLTLLFSPYFGVPEAQSASRALETVPGGRCS